MSISDREVPLISEVLLWACLELQSCQSEISILCLNSPKIHKTDMSLPVLCEGLAPRVIHWYALSIYWRRGQKPCVLLPHDCPAQQTKESCLFIISVWLDEYFILSCKVEQLQERDSKNMYPRIPNNTIVRIISQERGHVNSSPWAKKVEPPLSSHCCVVKESNTSYSILHGGQPYGYVSRTPWDSTRSFWAEYFMWMFFQIHEVHLYCNYQYFIWNGL